MLVFLPYYVCVVGLCAWSAWTERLSASSGLDYEVYCVIVSLLCIWILLQAFLAVIFRATAGKKYGFTAFGMAALAAVAPFISDPFDTLKDAVFGGLCLADDNMLVKLLGVFSWIWLLLVHAKLVSDEDCECI